MTSQCNDAELSIVDYFTCAKLLVALFRISYEVLARNPSRLLKSLSRLLKYTALCYRSPLPPKRTEHCAQQCSGHCTAEIAKEGLGAVPPRCAHDAAARMRPSGAHVERVDRTPVIHVPRHRAGDGELVEGHGAVKDVPFVQRKDALEIERRQRIGANDGGCEARAVLLDDCEYALDKGLFKCRVRPGAVLRIDVVRGVLNEELHDVLAMRRECVVERAVAMMGGSTHVYTRGKRVRQDNQADDADDATSAPPASFRKKERREKKETAHLFVRMRT